MILKKTVAPQGDGNILCIPQALYSMRDVAPLLHDQQSAIFYKDLDQDLLNIEFYTSEPCIVYIEAGTEIITTSDNNIYELRPNDAVFLPKGVNLYSDYTSTQGALNAYLLFFSDDIVAEFLSTGTSISKASKSEETIYRIDTDQTIKTFFSSLYTVYPFLNNSPHLLRLKLLEMLHLIDINDAGNRLRFSLSNVETASPKRNIKRLMEQYVISDLDSKDFAALSGRSVSSFNREFKQLYNTTPRQWLIEQRLTYARMLLEEKHWSVTAAANEVGYENISHFIAAFKNKYDKTPHQIKSED